MILFPPAKINLGLRVIFKRNDGYHEIDSCMLAIGIHDIIEITKASDFEFVQSGIVIDGRQDDNLCVKAFQLIKLKYGIGNVRIHLIKQIPMGAGLGGGSSDATSVLLGLNELFNLNISDFELETLAESLGSDCAFFVKAGIQLASGRGEKLEPIQSSFEGYYLKIINPGIHISTKEAYDGIVLDNSTHSVKDVISLPKEEWKDALINSFETAIFHKHPSLAMLKAEMYKEGAVYAAMSGSGSTIFGLYKVRPTLKSEYPFEKVIAL